MRPLSRTRRRPAKVFSARCVICCSSLLGNANMRGRILPLARANRTTGYLVTKSKGLNELPIPLEISLLHVLEQAAAASDHLQEALPAVVVLLMRTEVIGEVVDPI